MHNSPITGNEMKLHQRPVELTFRGEVFTINYTYLLDAETQEEFVTPEVGDANLQQLYDQYNAKHGTNIQPE